MKVVGEAGAGRLGRFADRLLPSRRVKAALALFLSAIVVAASATTYVHFYAHASATGGAPDVSLAAGADSTSACAAYPCATVTTATPGAATVSLSLFAADATLSPVPSTYYTDLVEIKDAANGHTILSVAVSAVSSTASSDFGQVAVYYCAPQCTFSASGVIAGGTEVGSYTLTSTTPGTVFSGSEPISPGGTQYIEVVAYGGSGAAVGDTISFRVDVQWA